MISMYRSLAQVLNDIGACQRDGETEAAKALYKEFEMCAITMLPGAFAKEGLRYDDPDVGVLFRGLAFDRRSIPPETVEAFYAIGSPNPHEGSAFRLGLVRIEHGILSHEGMGVLLSYFGLYHATLREALLWLKASPKAFDHLSVYVQGSFQRITTTDYAETPVITVDAGQRHLSLRRDDPSDYLLGETYAVVRRQLQPSPD